MKITVSQLRKIIREEVVRSLRLTEGEQKVSADDFNTAAEEAGVEYRATEDVTISPGDGGSTLKEKGQQISGIKKGQIHPDDVKYILQSLGLISKGPKQYGSPGVGGG